MALSLQEAISNAICDNTTPQNELLKLILQMLTAGVSFSEDGNTAYIAKGVSFSIPPFVRQEFTYHGVTNNIHTQIFKDGGDNVVATLTYEYVNSAASDNDFILNITQS